MRILILGAGAVGGYFGGWLQQSGAVERVGFLVRPRRKEQLDRDGLIIDSPFAGHLRLRVLALLAEDLNPDWDVIILSCKAFDLQSAIDAIRPAIGHTTVVLPILNGLSHLENLTDEFGPERVLGGLAGIQATLMADGMVRHLGPMTFIKFGELDGRPSDRVVALQAVFERTPIQVEARADIRGAMWEKLVFLGTLATATVLMRANLGEIAATTGGAAWLDRLLDRNALVAATHGYPVPAEVLDGYRAFFRESRQATASMLRDLENGSRIEADHIFGFLLHAVRAAGLPDELHEAAYLHAKAFEMRRDEGRLPAPAG